MRSVVRIYPGPPLPLRGCSSAGRAPALQAGGHRFDPGQLHQISREKTTASLWTGAPCLDRRSRGTTWVDKTGRSPFRCSRYSSLDCLKLKAPAERRDLGRALTFEQRRKAKLFDPPQGGHRINLRCNWMFDNEIDWVKKYKAEQAYPRVSAKSGIASSCREYGVFS